MPADSVEVNYSAEFSAPEFERQGDRHSVRRARANLSAFREPPRDDHVIPYTVDCLIRFFLIDRVPEHSRNYGNARRFTEIRLAVRARIICRSPQAISIRDRESHGGDSGLRQSSNNPSHADVSSARVRDVRPLVHSLGKESS
jgi:hypothetical protein